MDGNRFDALTKSLIAATTRRRTLGGLLGGVLGLTSLLGVENAEAVSCEKKCQKKKNCKDKKDNQAKKKCKKQCKKQCKKKEDRVDFCAGKNNCVAEARCERSGDACFCFVTTGTREPFCGRNANSQLNCAITGCDAAGETCVDLTECEGVPADSACAVPCPDPL